VSVFSTGGSLIPTIWGLIWDFTFCPGRSPSWPFPGEMCPAAWFQQPRGLAEGNNFPDLRVNSDSTISWQCG
jgi:hypothetical protein